MIRGFYSLPDPREVGLKWRQFEKAREKVSRIEARLQKTQNERAQLEQEIRDLGEDEIQELSQAILRGEDDPLARHDEHQRLLEGLRALKREEAAVSQALPQAEQELRQVVYEHQHRWKEEADAALERAIQDERKAYAKAQELIEKPRARRLYLESLASWARYPQPTFGIPADVGVPTAIQPLTASAERAEQQLQERRYNEQLERETEQGGAA